MSESLDKNFWENRYQTKDTAWDIGYASPALMAYMEGKPLDAKILIPGAGNAYEAEALWNKGFKNITVLDIAEQPLQQLKHRVPNFPDKNLICADFFQLQGQFDIILEQTFFCALEPALRPRYVTKMAELLAPKGELAGLLFDAPMNADKPPYGGSKNEYQSLFSPSFHVLEMEISNLSISPRLGRELFFRLTIR